MAASVIKARREKVSKCLPSDTRGTSSQNFSLSRHSRVVHWLFMCCDSQKQTSRQRITKKHVDVHNHRKLALPPRSVPPPAALSSFSEFCFRIHEPLVGSVDCRWLALGIQVQRWVEGLRTECHAQQVELGVCEHAQMDVLCRLVLSCRRARLVLHDELEHALVHPHPYHFLVLHDHTVHLESRPRRRLRQTGLLRRSEKLCTDRAVPRQARAQTNSGVEQHTLADICLKIHFGGCGGSRRVGS